MLFDKTIFGPIKSRRLGNSLGVNLLPTDLKMCNFNCIYCECGWNTVDESVQRRITPKEIIFPQLEKKLIELKSKNFQLDSITFAGNGEPTLHPDFSEISLTVMEIRNRYYPNAKITLLSNGTQLYRPEILNCLQTIDNPILKLDSGTAEMYYAINQANKTTINFDEIVKNLIKFGNKAIIQTLLLRGSHNGISIDNTADKVFIPYVEILKKINPKSVMLYAIDRETPEAKLEKLSKAELEKYANIIRASHINVDVFA